MAGKYGVENLKQLMDLGFGMGNVAKAALADGKIDLQDLAQLVPILPLLGPAIDDIDVAPKELTELDKQDADALIAHGRSKLSGMPDDKLKAIVQHSLRIGLEVGLMISKLKK